MVGSPGIQFPITTRPLLRVTRTISPATSIGLGANIAPKILTTRSKRRSLSPVNWHNASPSTKVQLESPSALASGLPAATRLLAISTPRTRAPCLASGMAVVPSPQPRSSTSVVADFQVWDQRCARSRASLPRSGRSRLFPTGLCLDSLSLVWWIWFLNSDTPCIRKANLWTEVIAGLSRRPRIYTWKVRMKAFSDGRRCCLVSLNARWNRRFQIPLSKATSFTCLSLLITIEAHGSDVFQQPLAGRRHDLLRKSCEKQTNCGCRALLFEGWGWSSNCPPWPASMKRIELLHQWTEIGEGVPYGIPRVVSGVSNSRNFNNPLSGSLVLAKYEDMDRKKASRVSLACRCMIVPILLFVGDGYRHGLQRFKNEVVRNEKTDQAKSRYRRTVR